MDDLASPGAPGPVTKPPGVIVAVTNEAIHVATGEGVLAVMELQPANSRRMAVSQYLAGHPIAVGMQIRRTGSFLASSPLHQTVEVFSC